MKREVARIIENALREDRATKDVTSNLLIGPGEKAIATIVARQKGVLCGTPFAAQVFKTMDPHCKIKIHLKDGARIVPNQKIMTVRGRTSKLLAGERKALNLLQHLSGVATLTSKYVKHVKGTRAKIYDTRKTIPGLRNLQKYAVRCGGGTNHRMNLSEMAMVKDNHLKALDGRENQVLVLKSKLPRGVLLEIEAKTMKEVKLALKAKADIVLLDNMPLPKLKKALRFIRSFLPLSHPAPHIEVSGGVRLNQVRGIARLGVDRISVGAITHSAPALDISMDVVSLTR